MRKILAAVLKADWTKALCAGVSLFASLAVTAGATVTVDTVTTGNPWSKIYVNYTLGGVDAFTDDSGKLTAKCDAATVHMGAPWRMPTFSDFAHLTKFCTIELTTLNSVPGYRVTGKDAKSIFLPVAGIGYESYRMDPGSRGGYWSSESGRGLQIKPGSCCEGSADGYLGLAVRPVRPE